MIINDNDDIDNDDDDVIEMITLVVMLFYVKL